MKSQLHERLLEEIREEFPRFEIRHKSESRLQRAIHLFLVGITFGAQRAYMSRYHTAMFGHLYVPASWSRMDDVSRYVLLRHERVHLRQRRRMTGFGMGFVYLVPFFPLFLAYGRARIEWEAYEETIRATFEVSGIDAARGLREEIVRRYTSGDYGWMWPFPKTIHKWFDDALRALEAPEDAAADASSFRAPREGGNESKG